MSRTHDWRPASGGGWIARVGAEPHIVLRVVRSHEPGRWWWAASIGADDLAHGASDDLATAKTEALRGAVAWLRDSLSALEAP